MTEPAYGCDRCGREAEVVCVLPGIYSRPRVARVVCSAHIPRGGDAYGGSIDHYCGDGGYTLRQHLLARKTYGPEAVALMDEALEIARERKAS
jgi:hypothetical protein